MFVAMVTAPSRAGLGHDLRLPAVVLGVQDIVIDAAQLEQAAEQLADLDRGRTHQHRQLQFVQVRHVIDNGLVLLLLGLVDHVVQILARDGPVRGNDHHIQLVDAAELGLFGLGGTGHAGQLLVHAEEVLQP